MLILLPPSEGKTPPLEGPRLDLRRLSFPTLTPTRRRVLDELVRLCRHDPARASTVLGLGPRGGDDVTRNGRLRAQPCAPAIDVYTGVLYDALDYRGLTAAAQQRGDAQVLIASALWGLVRPEDPIPAYRLSGSVTLPAIGTMRSAWRSPVSAVLGGDHGLIVDLRSGAYRELAPPPGAAPGWVEVRVVTERDGRRITVSHDNKSTKGRVARALLASRGTPASASALAAALSRAGHRVEEPAAGLIDIVVG